MCLALVFRLIHTSVLDCILSFGVNFTFIFMIICIHIIMCVCSCVCICHSAPPRAHEDPLAVRCQVALRHSRGAAPRQWVSARSQMSSRPQSFTLRRPAPTRISSQSDVKSSSDTHSAPPRANEDPLAVRSQVTFRHSLGAAPRPRVSVRSQISSRPQLPTLCKPLVYSPRLRNLPAPFPVNPLSLFVNPLARPCKPPNSIAENVSRFCKPIFQIDAFDMV